VRFALGKLREAAFTLEEPGYVFAIQAYPEDCVPLAGVTAHIKTKIPIF
jgi:hypothetical protein